MTCPSCGNVLCERIDKCNELFQNGKRPYSSSRIRAADGAWHGSVSDCSSYKPIRSGLTKCTNYDCIRICCEAKIDDKHVWGEK